MPVEAGPAETPGPSQIRALSGPDFDPGQWPAPTGLGVDSVESWGKQGALADVGSTAVSGGARLELSPAYAPCPNELLTTSQTVCGLPGGA